MSTTVIGKVTRFWILKITSMFSPLCEGTGVNTVCYDRAIYLVTYEP